MDFDFVSSGLDSVRKPVSHHKKHSTFANVPFAKTNGLDDFFGYSAEETQLNQQLRELKQTIEHQEHTIAQKDELIESLTNENNALQHTVTQLKQKQTLNQESNNNKKRGSASLPTHGGNTGVHGNTKSLDDFLDNLDFKFKEEDDPTHDTHDTDSHDITLTTSYLSPKPMKALHSAVASGQSEDEAYIYNPSAVMDPDGHLPQLRRSSLSEDEQERIENQVKEEIRRQSMTQEQLLSELSPTQTTDVGVDTRTETGTLTAGHLEEGKGMSSAEHAQLLLEIIDLRKQVHEVKLAKLQLVMTTADEINSLRAIIRQRVH